MTDQGAFPTLIKELSVKSLVSGDKEARLVLQFAPTDEILDGLNRLHKADEMVMAAFVALQIQAKSDEVQKGSKRKSKRQTQGGEV
jgi:hypothetical protein